MPCAYLIKLSLQHLMCPAFEPIILNAFLFLHHSHCRVYSWGSQLHALEKIMKVLPVSVRFVSTPDYGSTRFGVLKFAGQGAPGRIALKGRALDG